MKKKYILIVVIFIVFISAITFYIYRWSKINNEANKLDNIKFLTLELKYIDTIQKTKLNLLKDQYNYDFITLLNKDLDKFTIKYIDIINSIDDNFLNSIANKLKNKNIKLKLVYEDYKTDYAERKSSIKWLNKNLKNYLKNPKQYPNIDKEILKKIFKISNNTEDVDIDDYKYTKTSKNKIIKSMIKHLDILYFEYNHLKNAKEELNKNKIEDHLKEVTFYVDIKLNELRQEINTIGKSLLFTSAFLIFFSFFIYYKEVLSKIKIANLKNELQQFVDALNVSTIVSKSDKRGKITYTNEKFCQVSGYAKEDLIGKPHSILRHPDVSKEVYKELWKTIQDKRIFRGRIKNLKKNGGVYYVDVTIIPLLDIEGNIVEYLAVRYEVTELILSRDRALLAEKAKGDFLSNMSHELRTPLNSINGFSSVLQRTITDEKQLSYLRNIKDSSNHLIGLINDILDLSKLNSGKFNLDYYNFDLDEKIHLLIKRFDTQLSNAGLKLNLNLGFSSKVTLYGDWLRISQIITNLISNAIKFTPKNQDIDLNMRYKDNHLLIIVKDSGIGMNKEAQDKIFKPFEQADSTTTRQYGGTGLGLSIVLSLVKQMNGEISLESELAKGTVFSVSIPLKQVEVDLIKDDKMLDETLVNENLIGHILIAEDNKTNQMLIGILVSEIGLTFKMANDGEEAVSMFGEEKFDLVLMDENMPNLSGTLAMKKIHKLYGKSIPIVSLTANAMSGDKEKFLDIGMSGYISKPIDDKELYKVLKTLLKNI